ncbi:MAG: hypothetical protein ACREM3_02520 [Candidatus Rokuibacteriota bacterium]
MRPRLCSRLIVALSASGVLLLALPRPAVSDPIAIVQDRVYRLGVFLVVDALVTNRTADRVDGVEATVEFQDFFGAVVSVEHTAASPVTLGPGHVGAVRVVTPYSDGVRRLRYRFTWRRNGEPVQTVVRRDIWAIGAATRDPKRF